MVVADGRYTGGIDFYAFGPFKAEAMHELADTYGWDLDDCYAYTDSCTDVPMLEAVGHPYAVNPDRGLRREATQPRMAGAGVQAPGAATFTLPDDLRPRAVRSRWALPGAVVAAAASWHAVRIHGRRAG